MKRICCCSEQENSSLIIRAKTVPFKTIFSLSRFRVYCTNCVPVAALLAVPARRFVARLTRVPAVTSLIFDPLILVVSLLVWLARSLLAELFNIFLAQVRREYREFSAPSPRLSRTERADGWSTFFFFFFWLIFIFRLIRLFRWCVSLAIDSSLVVSHFLGK